MKKLLPFISLILLSSCATPPKPPEVVPTVYIKPIEYIKWETSIDVAINRSNVENKLLMMYFYAKTCTWCDLMNNSGGAFDDDETKAFINKKLVALKLDVEESEFAKRLEIVSIPTLIIVSPANYEGTGDVVGVNVGYLSPKSFNEFIIESSKKIVANN